MVQESHPKEIIQLPSCPLIMLKQNHFQRVYHKIWITWVFLLILMPCQKNDATAASVNHSVQDIANTSEISNEVSDTQTPDNTQETDTDKDLTTPDGNKAPFAEIPSPTFSEQYGSFTPTCTFGEYIDITDSPYTPAPEDVMHIAQLTSPIPGGKSFTDPGSINTARKCRPQRYSKNSVIRRTMIKQKDMQNS
nr:uncharacterized protein LOC127329751 [Lolium perenne]